MNIRTKKAQNTAEYAIVIALVVAVAVAMQTYVKRGLQAGVKFAVDKVKKSDTAQGQYEPYYLESSYDTKISAYKDTEKTTEGGGVTRTFGVDDGSVKTITRSGSQKLRVTTGAD